MHFLQLLATLVLGPGIVTSTPSTNQQAPLLHHAQSGRAISAPLFAELEELARIVDISYCVGLTSFGIVKPFTCLSRCSDFPKFELVTTWNTGPLLSDGCGYIALDHGKRRVIVAFRGTYSVANTVVDLSTVSQEYVPYPGEGGNEGVATSDHVSKDIMSGIGDLTEREVGTQDQEAKCDNCTVHMGFHSAWRQTRKHILQDLTTQLLLNPDYQLNLVGHSLGGAVAALAGLDLQAEGWDPTVTTFGEPRVGNRNLAKFIDDRFSLISKEATEDDDMEQLKYRRVTHVDDPVPLLPLSEWGYAMHAGEIYISKPALSPDIEDMELCKGDHDQHCIASQDSTAFDGDATTKRPRTRKRDLLSSLQDEVHDVVNEPWGIPSRYKLWQLFFAHRDYFWRLGLCVPGGDPLGGGDGKYENEYHTDL